MYDRRGLDELEVVKLPWQTQKLLIVFKNLEGKDYLDMRKWINMPKFDEFRPTAKGLMLTINDWLVAMEGLNTMIGRHSSANIQES